MPLWLKEFFIALFGSGGAIVFFTTVGKGILQKFFDTAVDSAFQSRLQKEEDTLTRRRLSYELLIKKEFEFYEKVSEPVSDIIISIQDVEVELEGLDSFSPEKEVSLGKKNLSKLLDSIIRLKSLELAYQSFIPENIFNMCTPIITDVQDQSQYLYNCLKARADGNAPGQDEKVRVKGIKENVLADCAILMGTIKMHLEEQAKQDVKEHQ